MISWTLLDIACFSSASSWSSIFNVDSRTRSAESWGLIQGQRCSPGQNACMFRSFFFPGWIDAILFLQSRQPRKCGVYTNVSAKDDKTLSQKNLKIHGASCCPEGSPHNIFKLQALPVEASEPSPQDLDEPDNSGANNVANAAPSAPSRQSQWPWSSSPLSCPCFDVTDVAISSIRISQQTGNMKRFLGYKTGAAGACWNACCHTGSPEFLHSSPCS